MVLIERASSSLFEDYRLGYVRSKRESLKKRIVIFSARKNYQVYLHIERLRRDENHHYGEKIFGPIKLVERETPFDFFDPQTNFRFRKGDRYLSIHLDPTNLNHPIDNTDVVNSMRKVARYVEQHKQKLPDNPIIGITYEKLARASRRFGFTVIETPLPDEVKKRMIKDNTKWIYGKKLKVDQLNVALCIQSYDDLIARFPRILPIDFNR